MSRFFLLVVTLAAIGTLVRYVIKVEGTPFEKLAFLAKTSKQAIFGMRVPKYAGRHWVNKYA